jgi:hypothetical protein
MKKIVLTSILILILTTSLIKNSTKEIEDKIFSVNENIRSLKAELSDVMLEYNYLSSPEKLIEHQYRYFENELKKTEVTKIKRLYIKHNNLIISDLVVKTQTNE